MSVEELCEELGTDSETGLDNSTVREKRDRYGRNKLREVESRGILSIVWDQLKSLIVLLLALAGIVAFFFGEIVESIAVFVVIVLNTLIGFFTEYRALKSMESLRELGGVTAYVLRDGSLSEINAQELVPGDVVKLSPGDLVTADVRIIESSNFQVDESALTGESVPVEKSPEPVDEGTPLAERSSMAYKGTVVTRGEARAVVVDTGMETELGEISDLVEQAESSQTPLEERLEGLGNKLIGLTLLVAFLVILSGVLAGRDLVLMVETGIALAVAAVPEGLPVVATLALARGMWRMADRNALINRLSAVETLGSTTLIFTDKTGTLTENDMVVRSIFTADGDYKLEDLAELDPETLSDDVRTLLEVSTLCNNSEYVRDESGERSLRGDPMESALVEAGETAGLDRDELLENQPRRREESFSSSTKMMATFHEKDGTNFVAVKGAPEAVLEACDRVLIDGEEKQLTDDEIESWLEANRRLAMGGLRLLGMAYKTTSDVDEDPYEGLIFLGLTALLDPPRPDVKPAIQKSLDAGIKVIMMTGDMAETARNIAREVGIVEDDSAEARDGSDLEDVESMSEDEQRELLDVPIYSRVTPKQKLSLIELHQKFGGVAGMTGDGVNDAPALKKADIGIAMGQRGTQVAREASDMVLLDDAFSSIVSAIEQGRVIFKNIRKFVFYLLSCNVSEIFVVALASMFTIPLPILPLQILLLNLVTDVFPALALGFGEGGEGVMKKPPRDPDEPILDRSHWMGIGMYGVTFTVAVLGSLLGALYGMDLPDREATTISFLTLAFSQLWHIFNMRDFGSSLLLNDVTRNPFVWGGLGLCLAILVLVVYVPIFAQVLKIAAPGFAGWGLVLGASIIPLIYGQILKSLSR
jgi:Ca2+-transporting ATPase